MAGHNKWSQIKHKKAKEDAKKSKYFTKLGKEISVAARTGGGDPEHNARLRLLLNKAKEINMPRENALRAIKRGTGEMPGVSYEPYRYEGYGPDNVAIIIDVLTDNKNRTVMELRNFFNKNGGVLAESGAVSWMFNKLGVIEITNSSLRAERLLEMLLGHEVKDIQATEDSNFKIITDPKVIDRVKQVLEQNGIKVKNAEVEWVANNTVSLNQEQEEKVHEFLSDLEDLDDVQEIYTNLE